MDKLPAILYADPSVFEPESRQLSVVTSENEQAALLFLVKVKANIKALDSEKEAKCGPMLEALNVARRPYLKAIEAFEALKRSVETALNHYRAEVEIQRQKEQRRLLEEHNRKVREAEDKAQKERDALEAARREEARLQLEADREQTPEMQAVAEALLHELDKTITRLETRVEKADAAVQSVPPPVVVAQVQKTVTAMDGSTTTFKEGVDWLFANGVRKDTSFYRDDPRFKDLDDRHFKFDPTTMNKRVKGGDKAIPGIVLVPKVGTMTRQADNSEGKKEE